MACGETWSPMHTQWRHRRLELRQVLHHVADVLPACWERSAVVGLIADDAFPRCPHEYADACSAILNHIPGARDVVRSASLAPPQQQPHGEN